MASSLWRGVSSGFPRRQPRYNANAWQAAWFHSDGDTLANWRQTFDDLRRRRPDLAERACRLLLLDMQRQGLIDLDTIDEQIAIALKLVVSPRDLDPNRPKPKLPSHSQEALHELALEQAARYLAPEEIQATILLVEKRQLAHEGASLAEDPDTPIPVLRDKVHEFLDFAPGEAFAPPEDVLGTRAALARRLLNDQLDFISVAKDYIKVSEFAEVLDHIIPTEGNQGRLGGKAAGLILAHSILQRARESGRLQVDYRVPISYFLPSNGTLEFIQYNSLEDMINVKYKPIEEVREQFPLVERLFKNGSLPPTIREGLRDMLETVGEGPLVVRSSSLLEDRIGHAFSGKYRSLFIANRGPTVKRLAELENAIAEVYASVFHPDPIEYRREHGLIDFQEQMGVLIQALVGREFGRMMFPLFAGVAFSTCNMRWSPRIRRSDGIARLVLGLGTRAVDRTGADYPVLVALEQPTLRAVQRPDEVYRYSQHEVDVVDLREGQFDSLPLANVLSRVGGKLPQMNRIFSIYRDRDILPMVGIMPQIDPRELVVTFDGLVKSQFPRDLKGMLDLLEEGLGEPVDVEFAHDGESLYMLQCRSLSHGATVKRVAIPSDIEEDRKIFSACRYVQTAQCRDLEYLVLVDPRDYERLPSRDAMLRVARTVGLLNQVLPQRRFALMGPGRWGSRGDIRLGVPVTYADICHTALLVEIARKRGAYLPDVSFGTHFFNDLVESQIAYLPLYPDESGVVWNEEFLRASSNVLAKLVPKYADMAEAVRVIDVRAASAGQRVQVIMDGETDSALAYLAPPAKAS